MKPGIELIAEERQRQIKEEKWSAKHDDSHTEEQMATAALCYVCPESERDRLGIPIQTWPWSLTFWKPTPNNRIKELVKAGALIAAEIDRIQRLDARTP